MRISGCAPARAARVHPSAPRSRLQHGRCWAKASRERGVHGDNQTRRGLPDAAQQRCGFIAVIRAPNAGKSTLVNAMVGAKVSIVSHKVQTPRVPVRGIVSVGDSQLVFIDTPGLFAPKKRLDTAMVEAAWGGARDADIVVLVIDASSRL